jgi:hypothetical protein
MKRAMAWTAGHRKALTAAAVGALTIATYVLGSQNPWVVAAGAVLATAGVHFVPNQPPQPTTADNPAAAPAPAPAVPAPPVTPPAAG